MNGERALWAGVLLMAYNDLINTKTTKEAHDNRRDSLRWLGGTPSGHFERICQLAGVDAKATHEKLTRIAHLPIAARAEYEYVRITLNAPATTDKAA